MGKGDWSLIPEINNAKNEELREIGYTGMINNKPMTFQGYFDIEFRGNTRFKVEMTRMNSSEFTATYLVTRVII